MNLSKNNLNSKERDFLKRIKNYAEQDLRVLARMGLTKKVVINFPGAKGKVPATGRLALWILRMHGAIVDTEFREVEKFTKNKR
jgi:hypothetical protein